MHSRKIQKHVYPIHILLFMSCVAIFFLYSMYIFLRIELPAHQVLKKQMDAAEECFVQKDYYNAIKLYSALYEKNEKFDLARERLAKSYFACSVEHPEFYDYGLSVLYQKVFTISEVNEIAAYLPTQQQSKFKELFNMELV